MKNFKDIIKQGGDDAFERAMRRYGVTPKEAETMYEEVVNSSGGDGGESTIEYLDATNVQAESWMVFLVMMSLFVKQQITADGGMVNAVLPTMLSNVMAGNLLNVNQFAIDFKATIAMSKDGMAQTTTVADFIIRQGATQEQLDAFPRITKEQFYSLN